MIRARPAALLFALLVVGALLQAWAVAPFASIKGGVLYLSFACGAVGLWLAIPVVLVAVEMNMADLGAGGAFERRARFTLRSALAMVLFLLLKTSFARALRGLGALAMSLEFPPLSFSSELRVEFPKDTLHFGLVLAAWTFLETWRGKNEKARRVAELEARLAQARLETLGARLDPHFLFNALHTVNSLMHEDLQRAERLIHHLGLLLRAALVEDRATWSLAEEHAHTARFLDFVEARFGDRVAVAWALPAELDKLEVPRFSLQGLVENAVKHNQSEPRPLRIRILAERRGTEVVLLVSDDGIGFGGLSARGQTGAASLGSGLRRLEELLRLINGAEARLARRNVPGGGAEVEVAWPWPGQS